MRSISLARLLNTSSETEVATLLGQFKCSKNADLQDFLHNKAVDYEKKDRSRTFLLVESGRVEAFFSLALNVLDTANLSNTIKKKLSPINSKDDAHIACFLIGQLGRDDSSAVKGQDILKVAISSLQTSRKLLGGKFILVDAVNNDKIIDFYVANGFKAISVDEDKQTIKMVMFFR